MFANIAQHNTSTPKCFRAVKKIPVHKFLPSLEDQDSNNEELINTDTINNETIKVSCSKSKCPDCKQTEIITEVSENIDLQSINSMSHDQREYLSIHERLGHPNFGTMQKWSKLCLIPHKFRKITPPLCLACQLGKHHRVSRITNNKIISNTVTKPGDLIHMDQAETTTPGRPMTLSGWNNSTKITCFTIHVDSISKRIFAEFQTSTNAEQTIDGKKRLEQYANQYSVKISNFRADNGVFKSKAFRDNPHQNGQEITFCGVGASSKWSRHIRTIVERARTNLLHTSSKWVDAIDSELWTFAVNYSIQQWNSTPREVPDT
jgi:hypothetical protein